MSSPEVEKFEITDEDLLNEFNPNRPQYRQTKNKATYGIWADESDDESSARPGFGGRKAAADFTAPIGFISGGVKVGDKVTKDGGEDEEEDDDKSDSDSEFDRAGIQSYGAKKAAKKASYFPGGPGSDKSFGNWERHTKGIGQKLLSQMGYVPGRGLGKNLQGISSPVEAKKRRGKGAVGFHGSERTERSLKDYPVQQTEEEIEDEQFKQELHQWRRKDEPGKKKKVKYSYKTVDELIAQGPTKKQTKREQSELSKVKVIDMTGKEQRVLSGYHAISHKHDRPDEDEPILTQMKHINKKAFEMPELLHNLDLLVEMAEDEIIQGDKKLKYNQDLIVNIKHEEERANGICEQEEKQIRNLEAVLAILDDCKARSQSGSDKPLTLDDCAVVLRKLKEEYYEEYMVYGLCDLASTLVFPLMEAQFKDWNPISLPRHNLDVMKQWLSILGDPDHQAYQRGESQMDTSEKLLWNVWMPHVRKCISFQWNVREPEPVIDMLVAWKELIPRWINNNIMNQLVLPRLQKEVDEWNPLTDTVPIHSWLHPWLPWMGNRLETLYAPIRHKLANALTNWHPSDPSAKMILLPWKDVFQKGHMDAFIVKNIVPKLALCLQDFVVNPHQQLLDGWNWVMLWLDFVPDSHMASLLVKNFFPRWIQVLCTWLTNNPNLEEVSNWYKGWKALIPEKMLADRGIKEQLTKALNVMNQAASGPAFQQRPRYSTPPIPSVVPPPPPAVTQQAAVSALAARGLTATGSVPMSFKELIERRAEEQGILLMPIPNKTHEAKQIYKFGSALMYLDRGVIFMFENGSWIPVSLNTLEIKAKSSII